MDCGLWVGGGGLLIRGLLWCVGVIVMGVVGGLWRGCGWWVTTWVVVVVDGSRHRLWCACSILEKREMKRKREEKR